MTAEEREERAVPAVLPVIGTGVPVLLLPPGAVRFRGKSSRKAVMAIRRMAAEAAADTGEVAVQASIALPWVAEEAVPRISPPEISRIGR